MNYDILIFCFFTVLAVLYAYTKGLRTGLDINKGKEIKPLKIELPTKENREKKKAQLEKSENEKIRQIELENIENYRTSIPQRKFK